MADFPTPKLVKALPSKRAVFLLLHRQQQVLLEKRPPTGIWGGLWSLPEFISEDEAVSWCIMNNVAICHKHSGDKQRHTFSHYHLDYVPLIVETDTPLGFVHDTDRITWHNAALVPKLGLAAPIKQLLQQHFEGA